MVSVFIVDDEQGIIDLIRRLIRTEGIEVVGEAVNGVEALARITSLRPDIVITDIRMPGLNGIDLIRRVRERFADVEFIVISGYREFEYAKSALQMGVQDYLLKPIRQSELNQILEKLKNGFEDKRALRDGRLLLENDLAQSNKVLRKEYMKHLIHDVSGIPNEVPVFEGKTVFHFGNGYFQCAVLKIDTPDYSISRGNQTETLFSRLCGRTETVFEKLADDYENVTADNRTVILVNYREGTAKRELEGCFGMIRNHIKEVNYKFGFIRVTMGVSTLKQKKEFIRDAYREAEEAVQCRYEFPYHAVISFERKAFTNLASRTELAQFVKENRLPGAIERLNADEASAVFDKVWKTYCGAGTESGGTGRKGSGQTSRAVRLFLMEFHLQITMLLEIDLNDFSLYAGIAGVIDNCPEAERLKQEVSAYIRACMEFCGEVVSHKESRPVRLAREYVMEHYMEPIGLEELAKATCLSVSYFSMLFKNETGQGFSSYLQQVRIEKAKELLKDTGMRIPEIAERVGYTDSRHFTRLFIKEVGIKPTEYRKFYS